jgi:hypothetical protein
MDAIFSNFSLYSFVSQTRSNPAPKPNAEETLHGAGPHHVIADHSAINPCGNAPYLPNVETRHSTLRFLSQLQQLHPTTYAAPRHGSKSRNSPNRSLNQCLISTFYHIPCEVLKVLTIAPKALDSHKLRRICNTRLGMMLSLRKAVSGQLIEKSWRRRRRLV